MLSELSFSKEHISSLFQNSRKDPQLIERTVFAFGLLDALASTEMPFIFKGGTCLILLLEHPMRLSTDIDILVEPGTDILSYIKEASRIFPFIAMSEDIRKSIGNIDKRHFKFTYRSPVTGNELYILLDVVFAKNRYMKTIRKEIKNDLLISSETSNIVTIPNINCMLGDKLTAFAPHTTGILLNAGRNLDVMKQFYDVITLIKVFDSYFDVRQTYLNTLSDEIEYRENKYSSEEIMNDTFEAASCIASRGMLHISDYRSYVEGCDSVSNHVFSEKFTMQIAGYGAAEIMYLMSRLMKGKHYISLTASQMPDLLRCTDIEVKPFKYMKKLNAASFCYAVKAITE